MENDDLLTIRRAAASLGISEHHVRRLARAGALQSVGHGTQRRFTAASVAAYLKKDGHDNAKSTDIADIGEKNTDMSVFSQPEKGYHGNELLMQVIESIKPLTPPRTAARTLGIPPKDFTRLVETGAVPIIAIGGDRFIPSKWLISTLADALGLCTDSFLSPGARVGIRTRRAKGGRG